MALQHFKSPRGCPLHLSAPAKEPTVPKQPERPVHLHDFIEEKARSDGSYAVAYALLQVAAAQEKAATHLKYLGNGDAATTMGAIESFGLHIGEKLDALTQAITERE
jgi:hypothetical protein